MYVRNLFFICLLRSTLAFTKITCLRGQNLCMLQRICNRSLFIPSNFRTLIRTHVCVPRFSPVAIIRRRQTTTRRKNEYAFGNVRKSLKLLSTIMTLDRMHKAVYYFAYLLQIYEYMYIRVLCYYYSSYLGFLL